MKARRQVVAGIWFKDKKVLMGKRRAKDGFYGGYWEFPGGKVEPAEGEEEALRREFFEELGIKIEGIHFFEKIEWEYPQLDVEVNFYRVEISAEEESKLAALYHDEIRWFLLEEASKEQILPANKTVIKHLMDLLL